MRRMRVQGVPGRPGARSRDLRANGAAGRHQLVPGPVLRLLLRLEGHKAVRLQYCLSVLCLGFEAEGTAPDMVRPVAERCAALAARQLRGTDTMTLLAPATLAILLVDAEVSAVPRIVERIAKTWAAGSPVVHVGRLSWNGGAATYPGDAPEPALLLPFAEQRMKRARTEGGNRVCLE